MKLIKKYFILLILIAMTPLVVDAGSIRFNTPIKTSPNTYQFTLTVQDINLNYIEGNIKIKNGFITKIVMDAGWKNRTGNNNSFSFYHDGGKAGAYTVATIYVTMTDNSEYNIENLKYGLNKCTKDNYGTLFGENGNLVNQATYDATCKTSADATLKSLTVSSGKLSPNFDPSLELYSVTVENNISTIQLNGTTTNPKAKIISGAVCSLNVGNNICKITVQAEKGNTKTYTITVSRKNKNNNTASTDASIKEFKIHNATLNKSFNPNIKEYNVKVNKGADNIYFTFVTNSNNQKHTSDVCKITPDTTSCRLIITAEDGVTKNTYLFNIIRDTAANNNNNSSNSSSTTISQNKPNSNSTTNKKPNQKDTITNNVETNTNIESTPKNETQNTKENNNSNVETKNEENSTTKENKNNKIEETAKENNTQEKVTIPIINKEINKNILYAITAIILSLIFGIVIGRFLIKYKN